LLQESKIKEVRQVKKYPATLLPVYRGAIRIALRSMLMSRWRAMHLHVNMTACEQAPSSQFGADAHRL
jgi:hypothetical protein